MKKKFTVSYKVFSGGGSQEIELEIPEGACDIKIEPVKNNTIYEKLDSKDNYMSGAGVGSSYNHYK